ncbi:hypothetical protein ACWCQK_26120 [Streptomyces sp. NPDC002306]
MRTVVVGIEGEGVTGGALDETRRTRYETGADFHHGLLQLACGIVCLKRLRTSS